ncbi:DDE_Tnp_IS1595 domain-containing protein [Caerostris extrusa]|uniref:DDE_Tnp_IS1595 domain-containing protein n=1 Tax=Caerostris extrusa TaxID=172846 RepID=A0AAV4XVD2_CAEEX|nr:DDE_Tnp_IS1595 domain-containing protein [Caerostris extrusa]
MKFMKEVGLMTTYLSAGHLCGSESKCQKMPSRKLGFRCVCSEMLRNAGPLKIPLWKTANCRKTILLDETFLTKRKYNRGRVTASITQTVFGIFCKQDREGLSFLADGGKKRDLWPPVKKCVHSETAIICTDEAGQYKKIDRLIKDVVNKTTNPSKGEFVDKNDAINLLENENKHFKKSIVSRKCLGNIWLHTVTGKRNLGALIWQFIQDVKEVYPGCLKSDDNDSEVIEWSDLEDDVYDLDWEDITTGPAKKIRTDEGF